MSYLPLTQQDRKEMLATIGVATFDELIANIPRSLVHPPLELPQGMSEFETRAYLKDLLAQNTTAHQLVSFLGAGSYDHFVPAVVRHVISRGEFYTAYTPYQAEASQGTLQTIFEYQSMIAEITGLDVANASHYDGATAFAEGCLLALNFNQRKRILVGRSVHPEYRRVLATYLSGTNYEIVEIPFTSEGALDREFLKRELHTDVGCVAVACPNFFGLVEDIEDVSDLAHKQGALFVTTGHPMAYAVFRSPGEFRADIACGEAQPFGLPLNFGGPYVGYFANTRSLVRKMPGRLVGMTRDRMGRRAFVLTLQAREQHIRREKASSNICTNQALCALAVCVYLAAMGEEGLREVALVNVERAAELRDAIARLKGYEVPFQGPVFNEFVVRSRKPAKRLLDKLLKQGVIAGFDLSQDYPELENHFLVAVTETKTRADVENYVRLLRRA
jgi:glycine dehydrogenase subunit 1